MVTRIRRGKVVEVPPQWVGKQPTKKSMRHRQSRLRRKVARILKPNVAYKDARDIPLEDKD